MDYFSELERLRNGEIDSLEVISDDFSNFVTVWQTYPYQQAIEGLAHQGGTVTYQRKSK